MSVKFYAYAGWLLSLFFMSSVGYAQTPFVAIWNTENPGVSGDSTIQIPATGDFTYSWVDTSNTSVTGSGTGSGTTTVTFPLPGIYEVSITPSGSTPFHMIEFYQLSNDDKNKLVAVSQWGTVQWTSFQFNGCLNLSITATDIPDLSQAQDLSFAFSHSGVSFIPNINDWDVSNVTDLSNLFEQVLGFNQSLSNWDVSNVTDMSFMFDGATSFNQSLNIWDVSSLQYFDYMFRDAGNFNQDFSSWNLNSFIGGVGVFFGSGVTCENYSYTLYAWANNPNTNDSVIFHPWSDIGYSPDVAAYRDYLIDSLQWNISGDALGVCDFPLAVTWVEFEASRIQGQTWLQWSTATATSNRGFVIERSGDGHSWSPIGYIAAAATNSNVAVAYEFYDDQPFAGTNFYRLKQMDIDGAFSYSVVRSVTFSHGGTVRLYPNPVSDQLTIADLSGSTTIQIYDLAGRTLELLVTEAPTAAIDLTRLAAGVYTITITSTDGVLQNHKIVKQ